MTEHFLSKCFLIGLTAASGVGPIFLLTLNSSSLFGFWKGFANALGAALGDMLYFLLAMFGLLSIIKSSSNALLVMEGVSSALLIIFSAHLLRKKPSITPTIIPLNQSLILSTIKAFLLTVLNPMMLLFFIFISVNVLPSSTATLPKRMLLLGSLAVGGGSLTLLTIVALLGSLIGSKIKRSLLEAFSGFTGLIFGGIGIYLLVDFCAKLLVSR
jgi:threonine/homoserine/homoserine lactone efflux protein